jgi:hypothetical protein
MTTLCTQMTTLYTAQVHVQVQVGPTATAHTNSDAGKIILQYSHKPYTYTYTVILD